MVSEVLLLQLLRLPGRLLRLLRLLLRSAAVGVVAEVGVVGGRSAALLDLCVSSFTFSYAFWLSASSFCEVFCLINLDRIPPSVRYFVLSTWIESLLL